MELEEKIKVFEHLKSETESLINIINDKDAHNSKLNELIEFMRDAGMISEDFNELEENKELEIQFVKAQLIYDDLQIF